MTKYSKQIALLPFLFVVSPAHSLNMGDFLFQGGAFLGTSGESQNIDIENQMGNHYTLEEGTNANGFLGLGYLFHAIKKEKFALDAGVNAFYFFNTEVSGDIIQEHLFENLSYRYDVVSLPVYAAVKTAFICSEKKLAFTLDGGVGPNFITTHNYKEKSLDGGITIPDNYFSGETVTTFSATAGFGLKFLNAWHTSADVEVGYRFFYLGEGQLESTSNQVLDDLKTGSTFANALIFTVSI